MLPLYVTSGEPAGIGPDICLSLAERMDRRPIVILADRTLLLDRAEQLGYSPKLIDYTGQQQACVPGELYVEHVPLKVPCKMVS